MPGGGYRPRAGRPKSRVKAALEQARGDPLRQVRLLGRFLHDKSLSVGEFCRAANYLFDLVRRLEREAGKESRPRQRIALTVVLHSEDRGLIVRCPVASRQPV